MFFCSHHTVTNARTVTKTMLSTNINFITKKYISNEIRKISSISFFPKVIKRLITNFGDKILRESTIVNVNDDVHFISLLIRKIGDFKRIQFFFSAVGQLVSDKEAAKLKKDDDKIAILKIIKSKSHEIYACYSPCKKDEKGKDPILFCINPNTQEERRDHLFPITYKPKPEASVFARHRGVLFDPEYGITNIKSDKKREEDIHPIDRLHIISTDYHMVNEHGWIIIPKLNNFEPSHYEVFGVY